MTTEITGDSERISSVWSDSGYVGGALQLNK